MSQQALIRLQNLSVGFGKTAILPPITLDVHKNELWGVIGRNGAGKTTLLRTMLGLHAVVDGAIDTTKGVTIGYVPQRHTLDALVPARAKDLIAEGSDQGLSFLRPFRSNQAKDRMAMAIEATHTEPLLKRRFRTLSEGEKQRVLLARAMAAGPDLLVLDEPTSAMDLVAERAILDLLGQMRQRFEIGIVLVTHHVGLVATYADRVLLVDADSQVVLAGSTKVVMDSAIFKDRYGSVSLDRGTDAATPALHTANTTEAEKEGD